MDVEAAKIELAKISQETDPCLRMLHLASLIGQLFREKGYETVVVGGSAIELYTEGQYMSGDLDMAWKTKRPPLAEIQKLMTELGGQGGPRNWEIAGSFVDLLGVVESEARTPFQTIEGPYGKVEIIQTEMLLAERILVATYPQPNEEALKCARTLMFACMSENITLNWTEAGRLANSPEYQVGPKFTELKNEASSLCSQKLTKANKNRERPQGD